MRSFIQQHAKRKYFLILAVVIVLFNLAMGYFFGKIEGEILDTRLFFSPEEAYDSISAYSAEGRALYMQTTLLFDYLYPWAYSLFLCFSIFRLSGKFALSLLPFLVLALDYAENTVVVVLLFQYPEKLEGLAHAAGMITSAKWAMVVLCLLLILWAGSNKLWLACKNQLQ